MGHGHRCCCICWVRQVSFEYMGNTTDIGPWFDEVAGDWSYQAPCLKEAGKTGAIAIFRETIPGNSPAMMAWGFTNCGPGHLPAPGWKPRVIVNYVDADNYHFAQFDVALSKLQLWRREAAEETLLKDGDVGVGSVQGLNACIGEGFFAAYVIGGMSPNKLHTDDVTILLDEYGEPGRKAGLGNGANVAIYWTGFTLSDTKEHDARCPECICHCQGRAISMETLIATFVDLGGCPGADEIEVELKWDRTKQAWWYTGGSDGAPMDLKAQCATEPEDWELIQGYSDCNTTGQWTRKPNPGASCDALYLEFGPYIVGSLEGCPFCDPVYGGQYKIILTEGGGST